MSTILFDFDVKKTWHYENGYYLTSHTTRLTKAIAQYEIYKMIIDLPGHVLECGVYKGASMIRLATYRDMLESSYSRKIIGFDAFGKFPSQNDSHDKEFIQRFESDGGDGISVDELSRVLSYKDILNYELVKGDVKKTVPQYLHNNPELKIALLHIDVDVYKPTADILNFLFEVVVKGGIIMLDDYAAVSGATKAVDEFIKRNDLKIEKLSISHIPAFIRKI